MGPPYTGDNMTQIEKLLEQIEHLERERRYLQDDIEDILEKIANEMKINELYMEE